MKKIKIVFLLIVLNISNAVSNETSDFDNWKVKFKNRALASKISKFYYYLDCCNYIFKRSL